MSVQNAKWVIKVDDVPPDKAVHIYIYEQTDLFEQMDRFKDFKAETFYKFALNFDTERLIDDVKEAIDLYGLHPFSYGGEATSKNVYMSSSLTWNPGAIDRFSEDPHQSTLGSKYHKHGSASLYSAKVSDKNSYTDSLSFNQLTPFAQHKSIAELVGTFRRTLVRSRVSSIIGGRSEATRFDFGWHNDELIFINLRVNVPIITSPNYAIQTIVGQSDEALNIAELELERGFAYAYDTSKNHRPYCKKITTDDRVNMIFGVCPWFDYDPVEHCWFSNDYYGKLHPFEMLKLGLITTAIKA
jgi:hypothetical protein